MASYSGTLYTGYTGDLCPRVLQHKCGEGGAFTSKYGCTRLVYYEIYKYATNAIRREKQIKGLTRAKKIALIESVNPKWEDLAKDWGKLLKPFSLVPKGSFATAKSTSAQDDKSNRLVMKATASAVNASRSKR